MKTTKTSFKTTVVWNTINWKKIQRIVFKLQKRIHKAAQRGDVKAVRRLQKILMKSWYAKLLATRQVTQDNQGKKTAGVDGVKSLGYAQRLELANNLGTRGKVKPTRRIWIPKLGTDEKRPLGIPVMADRANQALAKFALEPQWEARFEPNSYGFRPGRATHDAIEAIYLAIHCKAKYVLDADISKCFDNIDHQKLLNKLNTYPSMRRMIRNWLKAGFMDGRDMFPTETGTPQGGVISPLLANIALHGMEEVIKEYANTLPTRRNYGKKQNPSGSPVASTGGTPARRWIHRNALSLIRYADDFVIIHEDINVVLGAKTVIEGFLKDIGLELKPSKTRICHTFEEYEREQPGFDLLGFNIRQFPVNDGMSAKAPKTGKILGFQTIIQPSKKAVQRHYKAISDIIDSHKAAPQKVLIQRLNPIIQGWANYYSAACSTDAFTGLNHMIYTKLTSWARYRHPNKGSKWVAQKYWITVDGDNWVFGYTNPETDERYILSKHTWTKIVRHIKVKGETSPFNGDFVYWGSRTGKSKEIPSLLAKILHKQKGKCGHCGLTFTTEDQIELDHIIPISLGGKRKFDNIQALHRHCHDQKTARDGSLSSSHDKGMFSEEPDEVKVSCPVLKTSSTREGVA
ncbi:MAG: group II intron reverse transcriptase/maturase [Scytonema sp. RU_4_4]|nr:group II intron reverse transcriptase/maturase [Scytonema sp. RU_4_4]